MLKFLKFWLPVILCMGFIFYASSLPAKDIPPLFPFQDILFHLGIYLLLGLAFCRALNNSFSIRSARRLVFYTLVFGSFYGLSDELHQVFVPGRSASGLDLFVDAMGSLLGGLLYR
jgi:VanZ family protein